MVSMLEVTECIIRQEKQLYSQQPLTAITLVGRKMKTSGPSAWQLKLFKLKHAFCILNTITSLYSQVMLQHAFVYIRSSVLCSNIWNSTSEWKIICTVISFIAVIEGLCVCVLCCGPFEKAILFLVNFLYYHPLLSSLLSSWISSQKD